MTQEDMSALLEIFKALANESRLKALGILANRECGVDELSTLLDLKAPTVSHHLSKLQELELVTMRSEGNDHLYRLNVDKLQTTVAHVVSSLQADGMALLTNHVEYEAWEQKILRAFIEDEQIKALPMGYKKRLVVLKWLANHFEMERRYTELEVNQLITQHHEDYCLLRREMVEEGFMARESGVYWRLEWQMPKF